MREPARQPRAGQVLAPGHEVDLLGPVLAAAPDVLDGEGSVSEDRDLGSDHPLVVIDEAVAHAVANLPVEDVLAGIVHQSVEGVCAREVVDHGAEEGFRAAATRCCHRGQLVVALGLVLSAHNLEARDVSAQSAVRQNAILLCCMLDVGKQAVALEVVVHARGTGALEGLCELGTAEAPVPSGHVLVAPPDVEHPKVGLQLGVLGCGVKPGVSTHLVTAVEDDKVLVLGDHVVHARLDAVVTRAEDRHGVRPRVSRVLEGLEALDNDLGPDRGERPERYPIWAGQCQVLVAEDSLNEPFHRLDLRAGLNGDGELLVGAVNPQRDHGITAAGLCELFDLCVLRGHDNQDIAVKLVVVHISGLAGILQVARPHSPVHERKLLAVERLQQSLRLRLQQLLALLREQRQLRRRPVDHDDR
mmetsp:Transcript_99696/g.282367  ORF Transcript_99696/g.282367 Transcript_99696/m.282367 type:complete len:416 (+) Transcript_99696:1524-2771(+)